MKICKKICLRYLIEKYEDILIAEGVEEAATRKKNIQFGLKGKMIINDDVFENIYLTQNEIEQIDIGPILALGAEKNYDAGRKYTLYKKMLERMN